MRILLSGLMAAAVLLCAGASHAATPQRAPMSASQSEQAQLAAVQNWLAATSEWSLTYDALTTRSLDNLVWMLDSAPTLFLKLEAGGPEAATPWAETWANEARQRIAAERELYSSLEPQGPAFPANVPIPPELRRRIDAVATTSDQVGTMMIAVHQASERYITDMTTAAAGRDPGLKGLEGGRIGLMIAQLEAESTMVRASTGGVSGPNLHFAQSQIAVNRAVQTWLRHNQRLFTGQTVDSAATAAEIRRHAGDVRTEIAALYRTTAESREELRGVGAIDPGFRDVLFQVLASLDDSAAVEARVADLLDTLAVAVTSGDEKADDQVGVELEVLITERLRIDLARRQMLARNPA